MKHIMGIMLALLGGAWTAHSAEYPLIRLRGTDLEGGAAHRFGSVHFGQGQVNYIYAIPTGPLSVMETEFNLPTTVGPLYLYVLGRDDDSPQPCPIRIAVNDIVILEGPAPHSNAAFTWHRFLLPNEAREAGVNRLRIHNLAESGTAGMPPWFMVAAVAIGGEDTDPDKIPLEADFHIRIPAKTAAVPEPLPAGKEPGFALRGTKGWLWTPEQYLSEIPFLAEYKMNFLMICYGSMFDIENLPWGHPELNRWWEPMSEQKQAAYEAVLQKSQAHGIDLCLSMNPNLMASRIYDYDDPEDFEILWEHYAWFQERGMRWFSLAFDDIHEGIDAEGQARAANALFERLRSHDPDANLIFCPTYYWGTADTPESQVYLDALAATLDPEIFVFWTGDAVVTPVITRAAAEAYRRRLPHRIVIWDNYPVNDSAPTLHLGPLTGREADLNEVCYGYMANPMYTQHEIGRIPLITCADYAYNPRAYDPARSIGQAIRRLGETREQQQVLHDLVMLYPGMLIHDKGPGFNPVRTQFHAFLEGPHQAHVARLYATHVADVLDRLDAAFPDRFRAARDTIAADLEHIESVLDGHYGRSPFTEDNGM